MVTAANELTQAETVLREAENTPAANSPGRPGTCPIVSITNRGISWSLLDILPDLKENNEKLFLTDYKGKDVCTVYFEVQNEFNSDTVRRMKINYINFSLLLLPIYKITNHKNNTASLKVLIVVENLC